MNEPPQNMEATPPPRRSRTPLVVVAGGVAVFFVAVVLGLVLLADGDGDDEPPAQTPISQATAGPYVDELLALGRDLDDRVADAQAKLQQDLAAEEDEAARLVIVKQSFADTAAAYEEFVQGLADVTPPTEAAQQHANMVAAGEAYVAALNAAVDRLDDAGTFDDAQAIILDPALEQQHSDFVDSCAALVEFARGLGTEIAVFC